MLTNKYRPVQMLLHWGIAVLIAVNWFVSEGMEDAFDATLEGATATGWVPSIHVWVGVTILVLAILRLAVRFALGAPETQTGTPALLDAAGTWGHRLLYLLMIVVPALGAATWFGGLEATADLHVLAMNVLLAVIGLHAAAALFHQYVLKDRLIARMMPGR